jgi:uncharacterized membrane protein YfcA
MRWDRLTFTALGGIAAFLMGIAMLLADERSLFAPVFGMVGGITALAMANHERLSRRHNLPSSALSMPVPTRPA